MSIITQQDTTTYSLFMSVNNATCFGWSLHPSSGDHVIVSTPFGICKAVTATCRERDWTGTQFPSSQVLTNDRWCGYSDMSSWWWVERPPKTCRVVYRHKQTVCSCILLGNYWHIFMMHGPLNVKLRVSVGRDRQTDRQTAIIWLCVSEI
jgi:hypothetical protein